MYDFSPKTIGIIVGVFLIFIHAVALFHRNCNVWIQTFPRSKIFGIILLLTATIWTFLLVVKMDLGEFSNLRPAILVCIVVATVLSWCLLEDFLAARSVGILALLAAKPILNSCFLYPESYHRFFLVILAYSWILCGLIWVGMPYLMRDQITWLTISPWRWKTAASIGITIGCFSIWLSYSCSESEHNYFTVY